MTANHSSRHAPDTGARPHFSVTGHEGNVSGERSVSTSGDRHIDSPGASNQLSPLHSEAAVALSSPEGRLRRPHSNQVPGQHDQIYFGTDQSAVSDGKRPQELVQERFLEKLEDFSNPPGKKPPDITVVYESNDPEVPGPKPDYIIDRSGMVHAANNGAQNDGHIVVQLQRPLNPTGDPTPEQQVIVDGLVEYTAKRIQEKYADQLPDIKTRDGKIDQVEIHDHQNLVTDLVEQKFGNKIPPERQVPDQPPMPDVPAGVGDVTDTVARSRGSGGTSTIPRDAVDSQIPRQEPVPQDVVPAVSAMENTAAALFHPEKDHPYETVRERAGIGYQIGRYGLNEGLVGGWMIGFLDPELAELLGNPPDWSKLGKILKEHPELRKGFQKSMKEALNHRAEKLGKQEGMEGSARQLREFAEKFEDEKFAENFGNFVSKLGGQNGKIDSGDVKQFMPNELQEAIAKDRTEFFTREVMRQRGVDNPDPDNMTAQDAGKVALSWFLGRVPEKDSPDWSNPNYQDYMRRAEDFYKLARAGQFGDQNITIENGDILAAARSGVGKRMWAESSTASWTENGNLGCAASVSEILQRAGVHVKDTALAANLAHQLTDKLGWQKLPATVENMRKYAGSVVFGHEGGWNDWSGGGNAHIGIVGENVNGRVWVYDNSSATRKWMHRPLQETSFVPGNDRFGKNMWVLVPPDAVA